MKESIEKGKELGFGPYVMGLYTSQFKEIEVQIQKEVDEKKQFRLNIIKGVVK